MRLAYLALLAAPLLLIQLTVARADGAASFHNAGFTSLELMREKGIISEAEYKSAVSDLALSVGEYAASVAPTFMVARWSTTLYGFVEADNIWDSTESFADLAGAGAVTPPGAYAGDNGRFTMAARNSRIGFKLRAPEFHGVRASARLEMDFVGNQPNDSSEAHFFVNPTFRYRHMYLKVETPIVDLLFGQTWNLFGWQGLYQPNTVELQGVPGELYSRNPQIRISKTLENRIVTFQIAVAVTRPPERDSSEPDGQAGLRLAINPWTAMTTNGSTGTSVQPLSVAVTGDLRHFEVPEFAATPKSSVSSDIGWGVAVDGFIPIIPASKRKRSNSLALNGEYAYGLGTADLYTGLSGGVSNASLPNPGMVTPAPTYTADLSPSLAAFTADGVLHLVQWSSYLVGLQYYFPGLNGRIWVSGNYSHTASNNTLNLGPPAKVRTSEDWADGNFFADVTPAVRLGLEYAWFSDNYGDGARGVNHRVQFSAFYLF